MGNAIPSLRTGQIWYFPDSGTRFRIVSIRPSNLIDIPPLVEVQRVAPPVWDDGRYVWPATSFLGMLLERSTL
jgi:hypothetical protein